MRLPSHILPALLLPLVMAAVAVGDPPAEHAWRADRPAEARSERGENPEQHIRNGQQRWDGARRFGWAIAKIQAELSRIDEAESELAEAVADLKRDHEKIGEAQTAADQLRIKRRERMIELRRELLELERLEVVERVRREGLRAHQWAKEQQATGLATGAPPLAHELLQRLSVRSEQLAEAADYAQVKRIVEEIHAERAALHGQRHDPVLERMRREVDTLRKRMERLQGEMAELEDSPDTPRMAGRPHAPPPPGSRPPGPPPPGRRPRKE